MSRHRERGPADSLGPLFPVATSSLARPADPATSQDAAAAMRDSEDLAGSQRLALSLVRAYPGRTASELAEIAARRDTRAIPRRLSELQASGLIEGRESTPCSLTRRRALRWWPK